MTEQNEQQKPKIVMIRTLDPNIYHQAREAALKIKQSVGQWITQAIRERLNRERGG